MTKRSACLSWPPFSRSCNCLTPPSRKQQPARIIRLDPRFDELVPKNAVIEKVADGFAWVEGPAWEQTRTLLAVHRYSE
jgi:hypothetical protein